MTRLEKLAEIEGMSVDQLIMEATFDSVVPGICDKCDETERWSQMVHAVVLVAERYDLAS